MLVGIIVMGAVLGDGKGVRLNGVIVLRINRHVIILCIVSITIFKGIGVDNVRSVISQPVFA